MSEAAPLQPKSLDEHRDYLHRIVRLKLFFLHRWLADHPEETFEEALRRRVDIYRKTEANPGGRIPEKIDWEVQGWRELELGLAEIHRRHAEDVVAFEEEGFAMLRPSLDARWERDFADEAVSPPYPCGSLRPAIYEGPVDQVFFHIGNAVNPRSIFDNPLYLPSCFMVMMEQVESKYGATRLCTRSWLNSHPRWLELFPPEWRENLGPPIVEVEWHLGFWGQFLTARRTFHEKNAAYLRQHGWFKYEFRAGTCGIREMRSHLIENFFRRSDEKTGADDSRRSVKF